MRGIRVPEGYAPITYKQLAAMTGMSERDAEQGAREMQAAGIIDFKRIGGVLFYRINIGKEARRCLT